MTGRELVSILRENDLGDCRIAVVDDPETDFNSLIFIHDDTSTKDYLDVTVIDFMDRTISRTNDWLQADDLYEH
jgi:hypothetical protein